MTICDNCIHDCVCGCEGHLDEAMTFCADRVATPAYNEAVKELWNCRNELCLRCGKYERAYLGACNDCRYNDENMQRWKRDNG